MGEIFLTADLHLSHDRILIYEAINRPFKTIKKHDETIIRNWNNKVSQEDTIYILGDFSMKGTTAYQWYEQTVPKLNGHKVLILGNHDKLNPFKYIEFGFEEVHTSYVLINCCFVHDPADVPRLENLYPLISTFFCGHVHSLFKNTTTQKGSKVINVGIDVRELSPVSYKEIITSYF